MFDNINIIGFLFYFFWELSLFALAFSLAGWATVRGRTLDGGDDNAAEFILWWLTIKLLLGAAIPHTALFFGGLSPSLFYWAAAVCVLATGGILYRLIQSAPAVLYKTPASFFFKTPATLCKTEDATTAFVKRLTSPTAFVCAAVLLLAPVVSGLAVPIMEIDSYMHFAYMLGFIDGTTHPFEFINNYVALWESAYLPALVLTDTTRLHVLTSLQAPVLFALASYLLSRRLGLGAVVSGLIALTAILGGHLWGPNITGVGTLKNDAISAAGVMLLVLAAVRFITDPDEDVPLRSSTLIPLLGGVVFASAKFSGPVIAGVIFFFLAVFFGRRMLKIKTASLAPLLTVLALFLVTSGVYYLRNIYQFGNPFYPFVMNLGFIMLPGPFDATGTRIVDYLFEPQIWRYFFGLDSATFLNASSRTAILTPVWFALFLLAPLLIRPQALYTKPVMLFTAPQALKLFWFLWLTILALWLLFMQTTRSAGVPQAPYFFIQSHNTLRYAIAHFQLLMTFVILLLFAKRSTRPLGFALLIIELLGRLARLYGLFAFPGLITMTTGAYVISASAVIAVATVVFARVQPSAAVMCLLLLTGVISPWLYEENKTHRGRQFAMDDIAVKEETARRCSTAILKWPGIMEGGFPSNAFVATGADMKCDYRGIITPAQLEGREGVEGGIRREFKHGSIHATSWANYLAVVTPRDLDLKPDFLATSTWAMPSDEDALIIGNRLKPVGYGLMQMYDLSAVYGRFTPLPRSELPPGPIDLYTGFPLPPPLLKGAPRIFTTPLSAGIFRMQNGELFRYDEGAGAENSRPVVLKNISDGTTAEFYYQDGDLIPTPASRERLVTEFNTDFFQSLREEDGVFTFSGAGQSEAAVEQVNGEPVFTLTATEDMPWLAVFLHAPRLTDTRFHRMEVEVSGSPSLRIMLEAFDFEGEGDGSNHPVSPIELKDDAESAASLVFSFGEDLRRDYVAVTASPIKAGQKFSIHSLRVDSSNWPPTVLFR